MAMSIEIEVPKERKNKKEEKMIRLEPRLGFVVYTGLELPFEDYYLDQSAVS